MATIAQREEMMAVVARLRAGGVMDAASRVRVDRNRRIVLDEDLFAEIMRKTEHHIIPEFTGHP